MAFPIHACENISTKSPNLALGCSVDSCPPEGVGRLRMTTSLIWTQPDQATYPLGLSEPRVRLDVVKTNVVMDSMPRRLALEASALTTTPPGLFKIKSNCFTSQLDVVQNDLLSNVFIAYEVRGYTSCHRNYTSTKQHRTTPELRTLNTDQIRCDQTVISGQKSPSISQTF